MHIQYLDQFQIIERVEFCKIGICLTDEFIAGAKFCLPSDHAEFGDRKKLLSELNLNNYSHDGAIPIPNY